MLRYEKIKLLNGDYNTVNNSDIDPHFEYAEQKIRKKLSKTRKNLYTLPNTVIYAIINTIAVAKPHYRLCKVCVYCIGV